MRGSKAKNLRAMAGGNEAEYVKRVRNNPIMLTADCTRAFYKELKRLIKKN